MERRLLPEFEAGATGILKLLAELHPRVSAELTRKLEHPSFRSLDNVGRKLQKIVWLKTNHPAIMDEIINLADARLGSKGPPSGVSSSMKMFIERMDVTAAPQSEITCGNYRRV